MALLFAARAACAETDLILCNSTPLQVSSVIAYQDKSEWRTRGWFSVNPGECVVPDIKTGNSYIYAHAISGAVEWGGKHKFCIDSRKAFHYRNKDNCADTAAFKEHNMADNVAYTINYECTDCDYIPTPQYYKNGPPLKVYGKWCGPGYPKGFDPGPPIDVIDTACFEHDQSYVQCARIPNQEEQLNCEMKADSNLMSEFRSITSAGKHDLDPARLAYVGTMIRYLSYQAQLKYRAREARKVVDHARDSLDVMIGEARRRVGTASSVLTQNLHSTWGKVTRGPSEDNPVFGREGWLRQKIGYDD
jgi:uncharacterized membrane protein